VLNPTERRQIGVLSIINHKILLHNFGGLGKMTERNLTYELLYTYYEDRENGDDIETIDYRSLIHIITELMSRVEQLEKVNKENLSLLNLVEKGLNE
jgi:hypothetical protein